MSNSPLVAYTKISPNRTSPRKHAIDTITIHCVVGQCAVETIGAVFAPSSRQASSNYGIGPDGRIGMYCEEKDRSWCTSSAANDHRAVTIEVASDTTHPYAVKPAAYNALIELVADICRRNGIKKLVWSTDESKRVNHQGGCNMTVHRDYAAKACPGDYLYQRHGDIAAKVNAKLGASTPAQSVPASGTAIIGSAQIPAATLAGFLLSKNPAPKLNGVTAEKLAQLYISEGAAEGVRGDLAFCQSCLETGYWQFKGDVKSTQNNFAGIGTTGGGVAGHSFPDAQTGIRAQIQHLKAYATKDALKNPCVDPRYNLVAKGSAPTVEGLSGKWAASKDYATNILAVYKAAAAFKGGASSGKAKFPYTVKVTATALNVRKGPGTGYAITTTIRDKGVYTIVEEQNGWGRLKSGAGWISLAYTEKRA